MESRGSELKFDWMRPESTMSIGQCESAVEEEGETTMDMGMPL